MSIYDKVVWSEGMFLKPQHFQQHDRYLESLITQRPGMLESYQWGITELKIDSSILSLGKFAIESCRGILPDGTAFSVPLHDKSPIAIDVPEGITNKKIYLCLPLKRHGAAETHLDPQQISGYRYHANTIEVLDSNTGYDLIAELQVAKLSLRLMLEDEDHEGYSCLAIARILESHSNQKVVLDKQFLPACIDALALTLIHDFIEKLQGLLQYRATRLIQRLTEAGTGGIAEIADFMLLQIINRFEPLLAHLSKHPTLHPEQLFRILLQLAGELATFTHRERRPITFPIYRHHDLENTFIPIMNELQRSLSMVLEENAIALKLQQQQSGIWVATIPDKKLFSNTLFILAAHADIPQETLRKLFPAHIKIAPVEQIRNLVNRALPGIDIHSLPVAPRQIPFHANFNYFSLNTNHELWLELEKSGGIAFHIGGEFPGLQLEFWAIKQ